MMKKEWVVGLVALLALSGCGGSSSSSKPPRVESVKFATFHADMEYPNYNDALLESASGEAQRLQHLAEVVQRAGADVLLLTGISAQAIGDDELHRERLMRQFRDNYLAVAQGPNLEALEYPYLYVAQSNSGEVVVMDLDHDGQLATLPEDAKGAGHYPGERSFAILSKYRLDTNAVRTYQEQLWQSVPEQGTPLAPIDDQGNPWFGDDEWASLPLMDTNFVSLPLVLPDGQQLQLFATYLAEPLAVDASDRAVRRNQAQIQFLSDFLLGKDSSYIASDAINGKSFIGGYSATAPYVLMGTLFNDEAGACAISGYCPATFAMEALLSSESLNWRSSLNYYAPDSEGGVLYAQAQPSEHWDPRVWTGLNGLRNDYVMTEASLEILDQGVLWPQPGEEGSHLYYRQSPSGDWVNDASLSSAHRLVWVEVAVN